MAIPTTLTIASWIKSELNTDQWISLEELCYEVLKRKLVSHSEDFISDLVEERVAHIAEALRNEYAESQMDGVAPFFEVDNEPSPYIKRISQNRSELLEKLRCSDPFDVEKVCAEMLSKLGASAQTTQRTCDGGVDFIGLNLKIVPLALGLPTACMAAVIGQAKRYKDGNTISETKLREFVGAATLRRHQLCRDGKIGPLSPVLYAFWTTSDFDVAAKQYARCVGLWYMAGQTMASYVSELGLKEYVMALP